MKKIESKLFQNFKEKEILSSSMIKTKGGVPHSSDTGDCDETNRGGVRDCTDLGTDTLMDCGPYPG